jgi:glycosyltransferase involved in cell wall biosynthesis
MIDFKIEDIILDRKYISPKRFRLLYLGRMTSDKGVIELLHALKKLQVIGYKFDLKLVGEGEYMKELIDLVSELELKENVSFEGAVFEPETIKQYFINSDCYILGSYHEGFPRTLYEAMIFGTPILTTFVGGISALMQDRINCIEITPKSVESMYEALKLMMDDYTMLEPLAKNATETVLKILKERTLSHAADLNDLIK